MSLRRSSALTLAARGLAVVSIVMLFVVGPGGAADAAMVAPVTDYSTYPQALPPGCPDGAGALQGLSFSNGRGGTAGALDHLDVAHGDTVTMSWAGFATACQTPNGAPAIMVGLAAYDRGGPAFDVTVNQTLQPGWAVCGAGADPCDSANQTYHLSIKLPTAKPCDVQIDAFLGRPLAVVGPDGSFYSASLRGDQAGNRLISASQFTLEPCVEPSTTVTQPSTTVTQPSTTVTAAVVSVRSQGLVREVAPTSVSAPTTRVAQVAQLPATGQNSADLVRLAAWLGLTGSAILLVSSAMRRRFLGY